MRYLAVMLAFAMLAVGYIAIIPTASATTTDPHFWVSPPECDQADQWRDSGCWSHSNGGPSGAGQPTANNPVLFTGASGVAFPQMNDGSAHNAKSIEVTDGGFFIPTIDNQVGSRLDVTHNIFSVGTGDIEMSLFSNVAGIVKLRFGGTIEGTSAHHILIQGGGLPGGPKIQYTGGAKSGTMSYVTISDVGAVGKTIYCDPGCSGDPANTPNIIYGPCPGTDCQEASKLLYFTSFGGSVSSFGCPGHIWSEYCWSDESNGAPTGDVPTINDDVILDVNSGGATISVGPVAPFAHDVFIQDIENDLIISGGTIFTIHSIIANLPEGMSEYIFNTGASTTTTIRYSGIIRSNIPNPDCETTGTIGGVCLDGSAPSRPLNFDYVGPNAAGTMERVSLVNDQSAQPIYCFPGCTDAGGNSNIFFVQAPGSGGSVGPTPTQQPLVSPAEASLLLLGGIVFLVVGFLALLIVKPLGIIILLVGAFLIVIALFA